MRHRFAPCARVDTTEPRIRLLLYHHTSTAVSFSSTAPPTSFWPGRCRRSRRRRRSFLPPLACVLRPASNPKFPSGRDPRRRICPSDAGSRSTSDIESRSVLSAPLRIVNGLEQSRPAENVVVFGIDSYTTRSPYYFFPSLHHLVIVVIVIIIIITTTTTASTTITVTTVAIVERQRHRSLRPFLLPFSNSRSSWCVFYSPVCDI